MSLNLKDNFEYNETLGTLDFTLESPNVHKLRAITKFKELSVDNLPLTILAYREFGDHTLWWILATYNNIIEVDNFSLATIKIPDFNEVKRVLQ